MAERLTLVAHAATRGTHELVFGDRTEVLDPAAVEPWSGRVASWSCGPEPACRQTAQRLGQVGDVLAGLRGPELGHWAGRSFAEVVADDPAGLQAWLTDPAAAPHGGESLVDLIARVGAFGDQHEWPPGRSVAVVTPLVARAMAVHALGAPAAVIFRIDLAPLARVGLSRHQTSWRLQQLG